MPLFNIRELADFSSGANSSDTVINNVHFNLTALNVFNYTYYDNGTLSNQSNCWLTFTALKTTMLTNGTFINGTSCYDPYYGIGPRASLGIISVCLYTISIVFTLVNLRKHGRRFLPNEKRFRAVGRRWQWYWLVFVAVCGMISGITGIDVDRDYLQGLAIELQSFFYYLMMPGILAAVWEAVRHWGSWQERQIYDHDAFSLSPNDKRGKKEFYLPLVFYLFASLNFFMNIPRSWDTIQYQHSTQQENALAKPSGTDTRFKAGGLLALVAWCVTCYSLQQSIHYYKPKNTGLWNSFGGFWRSCPAKFKLTVPLLFVPVTYAIVSSFVWTVSPLKYDADAGWIYGLGHVPVLLIIAIFQVYGYLELNEDRALLKMRAERGRSLDAELGLSKKPNWWRQLAGDHDLTTEQRLKALTTEIGGATATATNIGRMIELDNMPRAKPRTTDEDPFTDAATLIEPDRCSAASKATQSSSLEETMSGRTSSVTGSRPQQVRSMLDI